MAANLNTLIRGSTLGLGMGLGGNALWLMATEPLMTLTLNEGKG